MRKVLNVATVLALLAIMTATSAFAQNLTAPQLLTLKNDILADATLNAQPHNSDGATAIANAYKLNASPNYWVWSTSVSRDALLNSASVDGTTFAWTGAGYITRSQGERDALNAIFNSQGFTNPSLVNVRQAFADIESGATAPAPANRTHLLAASRRVANRLEKLFAVGAGTTAAPSTMAIEGAVTVQDVLIARGDA